MRRRARVGAALYRIGQCTWGILQTAAGLAVFLAHRRDRHYAYHGAVVTEWDRRSSVSLGLFVFLTKRPFFRDRFRESHSAEELSARLLVHEYGHTVQSLLLGPLYLPLVGLPSALWGNLPRFHAKRKREGRSYFSFYTERWANRAGERATGEPSMEQMFID